MGSTCNLDHIQTTCELVSGFVQGVCANALHSMASPVFESLKNARQDINLILMYPL
jgi:hypothetical protein